MPLDLPAMGPVSLRPLGCCLDPMVEAVEEVVLGAVEAVEAMEGVATTDLLSETTFLHFECIFLVLYLRFLVFGQATNDSNVFSCILNDIRIF